MRPMGTRRLETERLFLRKFTLEDAEDMYKGWASDPEVTRFLTWPTHASVEATKKVLASWLPNYSSENYYNWAIEYKQTGRVIGSIAVVRLDDSVDSADMGYCMSRAMWGNGIMPEALKTVIAFLFDEVGLNRIAACHDSRNPKSGRVMEKVGMKREGILRQAGRNNQGICDEVWYSMLRSDRSRSADYLSA